VREGTAGSERERWKRTASLAEEVREGEEEEGGEGVRDGAGQTHTNPLTPARLLGLLLGRDAGLGWMELASLQVPSEVRGSRGDHALRLDSEIMISLTIIPWTAVV